MAMRVLLYFLFMPFFFFAGCSEKEKAITFTVLPETAFHSAPFRLPVSVPDSLKQSHDSCMGFTFDVNATFIQTRDTFAIGSIVNWHTLQTVNTMRTLGISQKQMAAMANVITNPCYEKRVLDIPLKSLLTNGFSLLLPDASEAVNKELYNAVAASGTTEMSTGSWLYLDLRNAILTTLDTAQSKAALLYKQNLLDTSNMILTAVESLTDVGFTITTPHAMSAPLVTLLQTKPSFTNAQTQVTVSLYYISDNKFRLTLNGFFPVIGQFTKAELK